ncbi:MAG: hypothetical protein JWO59_1448 [Chloroflexi bacterium]|nr:hypothetical protein [Chloroflexota bacterium]
MRPFLHVARRTLVAAGLVAAMLLGVPQSTSATTGPSLALPPSRYKVPSHVAQDFLGSYELRSVASSAGIRTSALGVELRRGFLFGLAQFYGYNLEGNQTLWVNILYNFHLSPKGVMVIDLLAPGGGPIMGRLHVARTKQGDLHGQIELRLGTYAISWHKVSNHWAPSQG